MTSVRREHPNPPIFELAIMYTTLDELEAGDHAKASMDFGRGVKYACDLLRARLAKPLEVAHDFELAEVTVYSAEEIRKMDEHVAENEELGE